MGRHVRIDYLTLDDDEIDTIVDSLDEGEPVVLQRPTDVVSPLLSDDARENFDRLRTALEAVGADLQLVSTQTGSVTMDDDEWGTTQTITAVVTAALVFALLPVLLVLRLLFEISGDPRLLRAQRWLLARVTINDFWAASWMADMEATTEHVRTTVESVRESTGTAPVVVTHYHVDLDGSA